MKRTCDRPCDRIGLFLKWAISIRVWLLFQEIWPLSDISWRIIVNRFYFDASTMQCLKACWALPKLCTIRSVSSLEGTCRCSTYLGNIPEAFSSVFRCFDFVSATCPCYTSLLPVAPVGTTHFGKAKKYFKSAMLNDVTGRHQCYLLLYPVLLYGCLSRTGNYQFINLIGWKQYWK